MAITIIDEPTHVARYGQKLISIVSSTNVGQPNFRYVFRFYDAISGTYFEDILMPPNPSNVGLLDFKDIAKQVCKLSPINRFNQKSYISNNTDFAVPTFFGNCQGYLVLDVLEGYDVDGVFTIDEESSTQGFQNANIIFINGHYRVIDGYKPNPNLSYSLTGNTSLLMGSRKPTTHYHNGTVNLNHTSQRVFIPVRKSELDWGSLSFLYQVNTDYLTSVVNPYVRMTLFESDGTPNTASLNTFSFDTGAPEIEFLQVYPANLNAHGELLRPADFPNWRYYDIAIYDATNTTRKSALYTFYPVDDDCRFDNIRLAWWDDEVGGFDFFNFSKKNEQSVEVERKRVKTVVGSYSAASFSFNTFDSELKEGFIDAVDYIDITSDWIQEGEFELLKHLVRSEAVYIVGDDGTLTPVLVENSSYVSKKERNAKLYNQTFRLRYSQQQIR